MRHRMHRHQPRRIAVAMLFAWLFATCVSWANACLVQPSAASAAMHEGHGPAAAGEAHALAHRVDGGGPPHGPDAAQALCASFCDTEQSVVAKPQPSKGEAGLDPAHAPPTAVARRPAWVPEQADPRWRPPAAPPPPGPPVAIAFLRLTL